MKHSISEHTFLLLKDLWEARRLVDQPDMSDRLLQSALTRDGSMKFAFSFLVLIITLEKSGIEHPGIAKIVVSDRPALRTFVPDKTESPADGRCNFCSKSIEAGSTAFAIDEFLYCEHCTLFILTAIPDSYTNRRRRKVFTDIANEIIRSHSNRCLFCALMGMVLELEKPDSIARSAGPASK